MSSKSLYALCFLALLAFAQASSFKRLSFNQGKTNLRNLDTSDSSPMPSFPFHDYSHNFAVAVNPFKAKKNFSISVGMISILCSAFFRLSKFCSCPAVLRISLNFFIITDINIIIEFNDPIDKKIILTPIYGTRHRERVNLGEDYLAKAGMSVYAETDMLLLLYTNVTGFCSEHSQFVQYKCENNSCNADTSVNETMFSPYIIIRQGDPVPHKVMIGRDDSAWQLEGNAILFNHTLEDIQNVILDGGNRSYIQGNDTYGFIGLGVGGDAYKNFKAGHPLFSIQVDAAGKGQLIFGKDDKLYDYTLKPTSLPASTNWTLLPSSITFGPIVDAAYRSKILFDLQSPGVGLDTYFFDGMFGQLKDTYHLTKDTSYGNEDFHYVFKGELSQLPFLNITLETEEVLSIPPAGYTRRVDNNTYVILLHRVDPVVDEFGVQKDFTMLGWPVLSQFYTIFELTKGFAPVVTMYPTYATHGKDSTDPVTPVDPVDPTKPTDPDTKPEPKPEPKPDDGKKPDTEVPNTDVPTASNPWIIRGVGILIVVVIILIAVKASQKKSANKLEEDLNVGLRGSAVL